MQPKAAKKIGGMTPKKMTGGEEDTKEFDFDGTKYSIKKTQKDDKLEICVSAAMPTGEAPAAVSSETVEEVVGQEGEQLEQDGNPIVKNDGGKKKRKSSKKRKSMKKKGGMKRKSMKVKA